MSRAGPMTALRRLEGLRQRRVDTAVAALEAARGEVLRAEAALAARDRTLARLEAAKAQARAWLAGRADARLVATALAHLEGLDETRLAELKAREEEVQVLATATAAREAAALALARARARLKAVESQVERARRARAAAAEARAEIEVEERRPGGGARPGAPWGAPLGVFA